MANRDGVNQAFLKRKDHICKDYCFPVAQITYFCFVCDDEIFKSQIAKHGARAKKPGQETPEMWYLCRTCHKFKIEEAKKSRAERGIIEGETGDWIKTSLGLCKMGPQGVPSGKRLDARKRKGY